MRRDEGRWRKHRHGERLSQIPIKYTISKAGLGSRDKREKQLILLSTRIHLSQRNSLKEQYAPQLYSPAYSAGWLESILPLKGISSLGDSLS